MSEIPIPTSTCIICDRNAATGTNVACAECLASISTPAAPAPPVPAVPEKWREWHESIADCTDREIRVDPQTILALIANLAVAEAQRDAAKMVTKEEQARRDHEWDYCDRYARAYELAEKLLTGERWYDQCTEDLDAVIRALKEQRDAAVTRGAGERVTTTTPDGEPK